MTTCIEKSTQLSPHTLANICVVWVGPVEQQLPHHRGLGHEGQSDDNRHTGKPTGKVRQQNRVDHDNDLVGMRF